MPASHAVRFVVAGGKPEGIPIRAWRTALKQAWYEVGEYHDRVIQPRKFRKQAASDYGYQPRKPEYLTRKKRRARSGQVKMRGERLLVYSGATRTAVLRRQVPRAFPTRMRMRIPVPDYVGMKPKKPGRPNMGLEIATFTPDELREMEEIFVAAVERILGDYLDRTS